MAKALKQMLASQLGVELESSPAGLMVIDPGGMTVESNEAFRKDLREKAGGARMRLIHNRTARVAVREMEYAGDVEAFSALLTGPSAVVYGGEGPIPIAKVVKDWAKKHKKLVVKAAVADGEVLLSDDAQMLAEMPDLQQLKGMLAGLLIGAGRGIAASLQGVYGGLARVIQARLDEGGFGGAAEEAAAAAEEAPAAQAEAEAAPADEPAPAADAATADEASADDATTEGAAE